MAHPFSKDIVKRASEETGHDLEQRKIQYKKVDTSRGSFKVHSIGL